LFQLDVVIASMAVIGMIGFALDRALATIEQRLQPWKETA
jgi:sulfonate transport system permease protein